MQKKKLSDLRDNKSAAGRVDIIVSALNQAFDEMRAMNRLPHDFVKRGEAVFKKATQYIPTPWWQDEEKIDLLGTGVETRKRTQINSYTLVGEKASDTAFLFVSSDGIAAACSNDLPAVQKAQIELVTQSNEVRIRAITHADADRILNSPSE